MILEKDVEQYLTTQIKKQGGQCLKFTSPGKAGVPDRIVLLPEGRMFFAELKKPGKRPRKLQEKVIAEIRNLGFTVFVIDTKEAVDRMVAKL